MQRLLRHLIVLALVGMAFAPTVGRADIVGLGNDDKVKEKDDKAKEKDLDDLAGNVEKAKEKVPDDVKGVPFTPIKTSNPEAPSLALMGVVITAAGAGGLVRRARKVTE